MFRRYYCNLFFTEFYRSYLKLYIKYYSDLAIKFVKLQILLKFNIVFFYLTELIQIKIFFSRYPRQNIVIYGQIVYCYLQGGINVIYFI